MLRQVIIVLLFILSLTGCGRDSEELCRYDAEQDAKLGYEGVLKRCIELADSGDPKAQVSLGNTYSHNKEYKDKDKALIWYKKAAEQGYPYGMFLYAGALRKELKITSKYNISDKDFDHIVEVIESDVNALAWYEKAYQASNIESQKEAFLDERNALDKEIKEKRKLIKEIKVAHKKLQEAIKKHSYAIQCSLPSGVNHPDSIIIVDVYTEYYMTKTYPSSTSSQYIVLNDAEDRATIRMKDLPRHEVSSELKKYKGDDMWHRYGPINHIKSQVYHDTTDYHVSRNGDSIASLTPNIGRYSYSNCTLFRGKDVNKLLKQAKRNVEDMRKAIKDKYNAIEGKKSRALKDRKI